MSDVLESSIASHLQRERTLPTRKGATFIPPYPSFSARFDPSITTVVMAYFGVQHASSQAPRAATAALAELAEAARDSDGPVHRDRATYVDEAGYLTVVDILYWLDIDTFRRWRSGAPEWTAPDRYDPEVGFFTEIVTPTVDRFETLFSNDRTEGVSVAAEGLSGEIREHGYWGGARDRMPLAQVDRLPAEGTLEVTSEGHVVRVSGQGSLCLIRSGQEWTETAGDERAMYLDEVEPVLRAGMISFATRAARSAALPIATCASSTTTGPSRTRVSG